MKYQEKLAQGHSVISQRTFSSAVCQYTVMRRLTTEICSEIRVVRQFYRYANVIECTYTNLDSTV